MQPPEPIIKWRRELVPFLLDNHDYSSAMDPVPRKCFSLDLELRTGVSVVRSLVIHIFLEDWVRRNPPWNMDLSRSIVLLGFLCLCYLVIRAPWNWTKQTQDHKPGKFGYYGKVIKRTHWKWWHRRGVSIAVCFYLLLWYFVRECLIASIQYKF